MWYVLAQMSDCTRPSLKCHFSYYYVINSILLHTCIDCILCCCRITHVLFGVSGSLDDALSTTVIMRTRSFTASATLIITKVWVMCDYFCYHPQFCSLELIRRGRIWSEGWNRGSKMYSMKLTRNLQDRLCCKAGWQIRYHLNTLMSIYL